MAPSFPCRPPAHFFGAVMTFLTSMFQKPKVPDMPAAPSRDSAAVDEARRRQLVAEAKTRGPAANYLTGGGPIGAPPVAKSYLTGQ